MGRITRSVRVEEELWNQAKEKAGSRKLSDKIEELLEDWVGYEEDSPQEDTDLLAKSNLTEKQEKSVRLLLKNGHGEIGIQRFMQVVRREGIYDRKDFIKKAVKKISKDDYGLYKKEGGSLQVQEIQCSCGAKIKATALNEGNCVKCSSQLIDMEEDDSGIKVI